MAEITPIIPTHPTTRPRRVEPDDKQPKERQQRQKTPDEERTEDVEGEADRHIDERV